MRTVLDAIRADSRLNLQIVVTGMHLDKKHGHSLSQLRREMPIDAVVPWKKTSLAEATGNAIAGLSKAFASLQPQFVLVVGDRVEALAAATAAHLSNIAVAHVHGGDRALGQVDDSLRHAITKLSHIHFPATADSARRILKLGEDSWRIHRVGSPAIDGIRKAAASSRELAQAFVGIAPGKFALLVLHPMAADEALEFSRAKLILNATLRAGFKPTVIIYPNNDPGSGGIMRCWEELDGDPRVIIRRDIPRRLFLGLLRDAAFLVGNSSSGIIEAASFGTPVVDIGPRQLGRERCEDVRNVPYRQEAVSAALATIIKDTRPRHGRARNPYQGSRTGVKIAGILASASINERLLRKLISY
ncbi:MAG: UDP-N-acetylglucosamine 2-epimerase [Planctomycetota bacterium]|nr:UDP-N-acetylglucosamine 2-epimerase [Planctomycetota bacterium]